MPGCFVERFAAYVEVAGWELAFRTDLEGNFTKSFSASQNGQRASSRGAMGSDKVKVIIGLGAV